MNVSTLALGRISQSRVQIHTRLRTKLAQRRSTNATTKTSCLSAFSGASSLTLCRRALHTTPIARKDDLVDEIDAAKQRALGRISTPENMVKVRRGLMRLAIPVLWVSSFWFDSGLLTTPMMIALSGITTMFSWQLTKSSLSINLSTLADPKRLIALGPVNLLIGAVSMFFQIQFYLPWTLRMLALTGQVGAYGYAFMHSDWRAALREMTDETDWKTGLAQLSYDIQTKSKPFIQRMLASAERIIRRKPYGAEVGYSLGWSTARSNRVPSKLIERAMDLLQSKSADELRALGGDLKVLSAAPQGYLRYFAREQQAWYLKANGVGHTVQNNVGRIEGWFHISGSSGQAVIDFEAKLNNVSDLKAYSIDRDVDFTFLAIEKVENLRPALMGAADSEHQEVDFGERKPYVRASYFLPRNVL